MSRGTSARVVATALVLVALAGTHVARADLIDDEARQLARAPGYKRRLAAVLALARSHDARAVIALAVALSKDGEAQIRRAAALALAKAVDDSTSPGARDGAFAALERAASNDRDLQVRDLATRAMEKLYTLRAPPPTSRLPEVFVHVGDAGDRSHQTPPAALVELTRTVRQVVARRSPDVATQWPGRLPTSRQLTSAKTRAFVVTATVAVVDVKRSGSRADIACTVAIRFAPWNGTDGVEKWVAHKAASASGSGRATTGSAPAMVAGGIRDCVLAVAEEVTAKQVVPFLKRVVADG